MMKKYFLAFDFYNSDLNKFHHLIITADLGKEHVIDIAKDIISNDFNIDPLTVTIKITALNNIEF